MRLFVPCLTVLLAVTGVELGHAAIRVERDQKAGIEFHLEGHLLTATIVPQDLEIVPGTAQELQGHLVRASCGTRLAQGKGRVTHRTRRWPPGKAALKYWFGRDLSAGVRWCILEEGGREGGADIAVVYFKRPKHPAKAASGRF